MFAQLFIVFGDKEEPARDEQGDQDEQQRGKDPPHTSSIEIPEAEAPGCEVLEQDRGDQKTRYHEKYVHPDVSARNPFRENVIADHEKDGDRT